LFYYCKHDLWSAPADKPLNRKKEEDELKLAIYMWLSDRTPWGDLYEYNPVRWSDPCSWFDINEDHLGAPLVNFAKFLLDCPVQSASCERLFKDFARFLSKHRSRLLKKKLVMSAMIKYDMKHKYPQDLAGNTGSRSQKNLHKNRFVKPDEYTRHQEQSESTAMAMADDNDDSDVTKGLWESSPGESAFEGEIPQALQDDIPVEYDVDRLRTILAAIRCTMPEEEEDDFFECVLDDDEVRNAANLAADAALMQVPDDEDDELERRAQAVLAQERRRREEDGYEKGPLTLEPLPEENDPNYPQENKAYFARKRYVRLDKYELSQFIFDDAPMPTIRDSFK
jgi:hypothetical protein